MCEPGHFATYLQRQGRPFILIRVDQNASIPPDVAHFSGLCLLGGAMSVNDDLPWIPEVLKLIQQADQLCIPVIGHCLGGQLLAKALGARVTRNPVKEIGWGQLSVANNPVAQRWLCDAEGRAYKSFTTFQWHGEAFDFPAQATPLFSSAYCANQGYLVERQDASGRTIAHLGMQCHIEMTERLIRQWVATGADEIAIEIATTGGPGVQTPNEILENLEQRTATLNTMAEMLYKHWLERVQH